MSAALKRTACALDFRYAIETFGDRFIVDKSFSVDFVNTIIGKLRKTLEDRSKMIGSAVDTLCRATSLKKKEAKQNVSNAYDILNKMIIDISSVPENESELKNAFSRFFTAENEKIAFQKWTEDKGVWGSRLYISKRKISPKVPTKVSTTPSSTTDHQTSIFTKVSSTVIHSRTKAQGVQFKDHRVIIPQPGDKEIIEQLSAIPYSVAEDIISREKYSQKPAASFIRKLAPILHKQLNSATKQYIICQWVLYTHEWYHTGIKPLFEFIQKHWVNENESMKVVRFCSKFDIFWKLSSFNKRIHPKFEMPTGCKLQTQDYQDFLNELGEADEDSRIVGEGLMIHFNRTRAHLEDISTSTITNGP